MNKFFRTFSLGMLAAGVAGFLGMASVFAFQSYQANFPPNINTVQAASVDASFFNGSTTNDYCDKVAAAWKFASAAAIATVDARGLNDNTPGLNTTCTPATSNHTFDYMPVGGVTLLGQVSLTIGTSTTELGVPGWTVPNKGTLKGISPTLTIINANNAGCGTIVSRTTNCTNWGIRSFLPSAGTPPTLGGSGAGKYVNMTATPINSNTGTVICSNPGTWSKVGAGANTVVTFICGSATTLSPQISPGNGILAANQPSPSIGQTISISGTAGCTATVNGVFSISAVSTTTNTADTISFAQANANPAGCSGGSVSEQPYPQNQPGELVQVQSLTGTAGDTNWNMYRLCSNNNPNANGASCINPTNAVGAGNVQIGFYNGNSPNVTTNGGVIYFGTPVVSCGPGAIAQAVISPGTTGSPGLNGSHCQIMDLSISSKNIPGAIGLQNVSQQEQSTINYVTSQGSPFANFDFHNGGASGEGNSGPYTQLYSIHQTNQNCNYATIDMFIGDQFTRDFQGATLIDNGCGFNNTVNSTGAPGPPTDPVTGAAPTQPHQALLADGPNLSVAIAAFHVEGVTVGVEEGANMPTVAFAIMGFHGKNTLAECVDVSNNFSGGTNSTNDVLMTRINQGLSPGCTTLIADNIVKNGVTYSKGTGSGNGKSAFYAWDCASGSLTTCNVLSTDTTQVQQSASAFKMASQTLQVTGANYTTSATTLAGAGVITGLNFVAPVNAQMNWNFSCNVTYSQATAAAANLWGITTAGTAPTNLSATFEVYTTQAGAMTVGHNVAIGGGTSTTVLTSTPGAAGAIGTTASMFTAHIWGTAELPSNATASQIGLAVATGAGADALTIYRDLSSCNWY